MENGYNTDLAVYTLDGEDKTYKGVLYPSLKRLFLELGDPTEYQFAVDNLYDWPHWKRLCKNKVIQPHIKEWRDELSLKLQSEGVLSIINLATSEGSYQASKWLADKNWVQRERGRPTTDQVKGALAKRVRENSEFDQDDDLLSKHLNTRPN